MSLTPYGRNDGGGLIQWGFELANTLLFYANYLSTWLDIAPVIIRAELRQLGRNGVDRLPFLSDETKWKVKRWLRDYFGL